MDLKMVHLLTTFAILLATANSFATADLDFFRNQELDINPHLWVNGLLENTTINVAAAHGCSYCGEFYYHEPPPDDILFIPAPPLHPNLYSDLNDESQSDSSKLLSQGAEKQCNFCNIFNPPNELSGEDTFNQSINNRITSLLIAFLSISAVVAIYLISTNKSKLVASLGCSTGFRSNQPIVGAAENQINKTNTLTASISNPSAHLTDPCFLQTNRDKNLTSPIISDQATHKKTSIPSKYWAQPGSIIGRTVRRIPNEYEVPSSRTNSTGTSSAVYAEMNNENNNQRFFSPYNLHTYAEVREVLDPHEHFHTSSNSSVMLSESNYDNAIYSHGNCVLSNGNVVTVAPNGSVQLSDFNSMRPSQSSMAHTQQGPAIYNQHHMTQPKVHHSGNPMYELPPHRAQMIITSNNQGINPTTLNYKGKIHDVI